MDPVEEAARRYPSGWARGFAKGKMGSDPAYRRVLELLPETGTLLDVGCGEGYLLALARAARPTLTLWGVDHDAARLEKARRALGREANVLVGDARDQELPEADVVALLDVLHYLPVDEQDAVLLRLSALLRPGGVLLVRDGESERGLRSTLTRLSEQVAVAVGRHKGVGVHLRSRQSLEAALAGLGLEVEASDCSAGTPFANVLYVARKPA